MSKCILTAGIFSECIFSELGIMKTTYTKSVFLSWIIIAMIVLQVITSSAQNAGATFTAGPDMKRAKLYPMTSVLPNGKLISFGGRELNFISCSYADMYDPVTNTFTEAAMTYPHDAFAAAKLSDGRYFLLGGGKDLGVPAYDYTEIYDPTGNTFTSKATMTTPRMQATAAQLTGGKVLVACGWYNNTAASTTELYDVTANTFTATGNLVQPRSYALLFPATDGGAVITGGWPTYGGNTYTSVENYNITTGKWTTASTQLIPGDSGWVPAPIYTRTIEDCKLSNGKYVLFASSNVPTARYGLIQYDPATKLFSLISTQSVLKNAFNDGGIVDIVINKTDNLVYLVGADSGYTSPQRLSVTTVNVSTGKVYAPTTTFTMPASEYFYPSMTYIPSNGKILVQGINSSNSSYFTGTKKTYLLTPILNGSFTQTEMTEQRFNSYPNPASGILFTEFTAGSQGDYLLKLTNMVGQTVKSVTQCVPSGQARIEIPVADLPEGMYILSLSGNGSIQNRTIVIR